MVALEVALKNLDVLANEISVQQSDPVLAAVDTATAWIEQLIGTSELASLDRGDAALLRRIIALLTETVTAEHLTRPNPFEELFSKIQQRSADIYTRSKWREAVLTLAMDSEHPRPPHHRYHDPYAVSATTNDDGVVQLVLWPNGFGVPTYAVLSYILIHECICHVPARQDRMDNESIFAEGFMDWAATFLYNRWLTRLDNVLAPTARQHVKALHEIFGGPARRDGERRAEELVGWFTSPSVGRPLPVTAAPVKVAKLALSLNTTPGCLDCKDRLVGRFRRPLSSDLARRINAWAESRISPGELLQCTCIKRS